ncbi:MAG: hypothetical protein WBP22_01560 [Candidatus Saccharimonas sp.]
MTTTDERPQAPIWDKPTAKDKADRQLLVWLMRADFVLDGRSQIDPVRLALDNMTAPALPLDENDPDSPMIPVTRLHGAALVYLGMIVKEYMWVGSNETTTPEQAAINIARRKIVETEMRSGATEAEAWLRVETRKEVLEPLGREKHLVAQAFSLAQVFWHEATAELNAFMQKHEDTPLLAGIAASLREEYLNKPW